MSAVLWATAVITVWLLLVLPLAVACGRAFAAGDMSLDSPLDDTTTA